MLVGFMGAGKTTIGRLLAERLACDFVDLDAEVERVAGRPIAEIFRSEGEAGFRALEAEATLRLSKSRFATPPEARGREHEGSVASGLVIAAGGGWMARPELRDHWPDAVRIWLRVSAETALRRLESAPGTRPLLTGGEAEEALASRRPEGPASAGAEGSADDPLAAARALLARRIPEYALAEIHVDTEGQTPNEVAATIESALRTSGTRRPPRRYTRGTRKK